MELREAANETWTFEVFGSDHGAAQKAKSKVANERAIDYSHLTAAVVDRGTPTQNALVTVVLTPNR